MFSFLLDIIFPKFCCGCDHLGTFLCPKCFKQIEFFKHPVEIEAELQYCDQLWAMAKYQKPIDKLIFDLKYQSVKSIALVCAKMLFYQTRIPRVDVITFVPLHPKKQFQRGFNQAQIIAQEYGKLTKIPVVEFLIKTKNNQAQASLDQKNDRLKNIVGVYRPINHLPIDAEKILRCLIIDDVSTTGATINECAKVLKEMGIQKVYGLTVAHG